MSLIGSTLKRIAPALALFAFALLIRCIGLQWGLPNATRWYSYHPDEYQIFSSVVSMISHGDFNPRFFNYPSLFIYLTYIAHLLMSGFGLGHPLPQNESQTWMLYRDVLLSARTITALLGAATVPLVLSIARQIGGLRIGVLAALLLALTPGHVQHSHFATVDVPATFFVTLCLGLSTRALDMNLNVKQRTRYLLFSGFVAGLATATKYNAGIVLVAPLTAWFYLFRQQTVVKVLPLALVALCALGFLIGCPYSVLDTSAFWGNCKNTGFCYELLVHPKQGHGDVFEGTGIGWFHHLAQNAPFLLTLPLLLAALWGIASTRFKLRRETSILLIWCGLYFFVLGFSQVRFMRYLLPLAPALCIFATLGVLSLRNQRHKFAAGTFLLVITVWGTRDVLYLLIKKDQRDQAVHWLLQNTTTPTTIGTISPPWFFSPPLSPLDSPPFRPLTENQLFKWTDGKYHFRFTGFDIKKLQREKSQWFLLSEFEWREKKRRDDFDYIWARKEQPSELRVFTGALEQEYDLIEVFKNEAPLALPGRDFVPHDFLYTNPEIRIYRRNVR